MEYYKLHSLNALSLNNKSKNIIFIQIKLQRISTRAETAVDHSAGPTLVCRLIFAFK